MPLTQVQIKAYVKDCSCPYCGCDSLMSGQINPRDALHAYASVECCGCHREWEDIYTLTGLEELE